MISLLITLALLSLIVWIITTYIAKSEPFRTIIIAVSAIFAILYIMSVMGVVDIPLSRIRN